MLQLAPHKTKFHLCSPFFIAILINVVILCATLLITELHYESNDDYALARMVGNQARFNVGFTNRFLCMLVYALQQLMPAVNMWVFLQIILSFCAFCVLSYLFLSKGVSRLNICFAITIPIIFAYDHYDTFQFTKTAALLLSAGALLTIHAYRTGRTRFYIPAVCFLYLGAAYRFDNLLPAIALFSVFMAAFFIFKHGFSPRAALSFIEKRKLASIFCMVLITGLFLSQWASETINMQTENYAEWKEYNRTRARFTDYPNLNYEENTAFFENLGISAQDFSMMSAWYLDPDGAASYGNLRAIEEKQLLLQKHIFDDAIAPFVERLWENTKNITRWGFHQGLLLLFLIAGVGFFNRRWTGTVIVIILMNLAITLYLFYIGRAIYRATYLMDLSVIVMLFYASEPKRWPTTGRINRFTTFLHRNRMIILCTGILLIALFTTVSMMRITSIQTPNTEADGLYNHIRNHPESFFVFDAKAQSDYLQSISAYAKPLKPFPPEYEQNVSAFGGWHILSPSYKDSLSAYGLENVYADIIDNENVYVIESLEWAPIIQYFNDHYAPPGKEIYSELAGEFVNGEIILYQVKTRSL